MWQAGSGMTDLGAIALRSAAYGINDIGQIVGTSDIETTDEDQLAYVTRAALWQNGTIVELGTLSDLNTVRSDERGARHQR